MKKYLILGLVIAVLLAVVQYRVYSATTPKGVVKRFYDTGADYKLIPELAAKVVQLNKEAGSKTGEFYEDEQGFFHGINYHPMWCAQDIPNSRRYELLSQSGNGATVRAHNIYGNGHDNEITISLQKRDETWNITDVVCTSRNAEIERLYGKK